MTMIRTTAAAVASGTYVTQYTVPAGKEAVISGIWFSGVDTTGLNTANIRVNGTIVSSEMIVDRAAERYGVQPFKGHMLVAGDVVETMTDQTGNKDHTLSVWEQDIS